SRRSTSTRSRSRRPTAARNSRGCAALRVLPIDGRTRPPENLEQMRGALLAIPLCWSCARGGTAAGDDASATPRADAPPDPRPSPDARPPLDASPPPPPPDACIPVTTQLLVNPRFDESPRGTGWIEQIIRAGYPLITDQDSAVAPIEDTAPYKV